MKNMSAVIQQLKREHQHLQQQLQRIDQALAALGSSSMEHGRCPQPVGAGSAWPRKRAGPGKDS